MLHFPSVNEFLVYVIGMHVCVNCSLSPFQELLSQNMGLMEKVDSLKALNDQLREEKDAVKMDNDELREKLELCRQVSTESNEDPPPTSQEHVRNDVDYDS